MRRSKWNVVVSTLHIMDVEDQFPELFNKPMTREEKHDLLVDIADSMGDYIIESGIWRQSLEEAVDWYKANS